MNGYKEEDNSCCYFHPKEIFVGICPLCLNERLLVLASKQGQRSSSSNGGRSGSGHSHRVVQAASSVSQKKQPINLPKIFALGSLFNRLELKHSKPEDFEDHDASVSQEDSFISIKFEKNGVASWEKGTVSKVSLENCSMSWTKEVANKSVIEHAKPRAPLRWRKRIGHLFQLIKWKRSNKANVCHMSSKVEGAKMVRKGWIRTLTKRTQD